MKIALYCPNKPLDHPNPSGDLVIAQGLRDSLKAFGHECMEIHRHRSRRFWTSARGWVTLFRSIPQAVERAVSFSPDIWLTYHTYYKSPDVFGPWISRMLRVPYVLFQPMYANKQRRRPGARIGFLLNRIAIQAAHHIFINNVNDMGAILRIVDRRKVTYLPPGIFPEDFQRNIELGALVRRKLGIPPDCPVVMTAARFRPGVKFQSMEYLLGAMSKLKARGVRFKLLIVGDGPLEHEVRRIAEQRLSGDCVFTGGVPRGEMTGYYCAADVFAFPGLGESLGMVYLEAQASGAPVVALNTDGVPQVVRNGETGLLVPRDDGEAFSFAVERLLRDEELRKLFGSRGRDYVMRDRNLRVNYLGLSKKLEELSGEKPPS